MLLAWYGRKLSAHKKATLGVGVILSQSYCYGCHDYDCNIYSKFFLLSIIWCIFWPNTVGTPYNTAPYITGSNIARLGHGSQNSWSKLWIPVVKSAPVRVIFAWKSVPKKRIHGSSDIYLGTQWKQRHDSPWPNRLDVIVTFLWYDTIRTIWHRDHQSTTKKV